MRRNGFTLVNLAGAIVATALLFVIVLPVLGSARRLAMQSGSAGNLRTIGAGHATYASEWNGRQLTYAVDDLSTYGDYGSWSTGYAEAHGSGGGWWDPGNHPGIDLGWGHTAGGAWVHYHYSCLPGQAANASLVLPIGLGWAAAAGTCLPNASRGLKRVLSWS